MFGANGPPFSQQVLRQTIRLMACCERRGRPHLPNRSECSAKKLQCACGAQCAEHIRPAMRAWVKECCDWVECFFSLGLGRWGLLVVEAGCFATASSNSGHYALKRFPSCYPHMTLVWFCQCQSRDSSCGWRNGRRLHLRGGQLFAPRADVERAAPFQRGNVKSKGSSRWWFPLG